MQTPAYRSSRVGIPCASFTTSHPLLLFFTPVDKYEMKKASEREKRLQRAASMPTVTTYQGQVQGDQKDFFGATLPEFEDLPWPPWEEGPQ